ncbi:MAG: hypothetical protein E6I20_14935 [Chloroflexi bacterium]|nr:MAG: hypothetical protein E6I20_14935 [Chloroflexota bacterium]
MHDGQTPCPPPCASVRNENATTCPKRDDKSTAPVMSDAVKACLALRASLAGMVANDMVIQADRVSTVCAKAIAESGLSAAEFWAKYRAR